MITYPPTVKWRTKTKRKTISPTYGETAFVPMPTDVKLKFYVLVYEAGRDAALFLGGTAVEVHLDAMQEEMHFAAEPLGPVHPDPDMEVAVKRLAKSVRSPRPNDYGTLSFTVHGKTTMHVDEAIPVFKGSEYVFLRIPGVVGQRVEAAVTGVAMEVDEEAAAFDAVHDELRTWMMTGKCEEDWDDLDFPQIGVPPACAGCWVAVPSTPPPQATARCGTSAT